MTGEPPGGAPPARSPGRTVAPAERGAIRDRRPGRREDRRAGGARGAATRCPRTPARRRTPRSSVHHDTARVRVSLELDYPSDIGAPVRRRASPSHPAGKDVGGNGGARGRRPGGAAALRAGTRRGTGEDPMSESQGSESTRTAARHREGGRERTRTSPRPPPPTTRCPPLDDADGGNGRFWSARRVPAGILALLVLAGAGLLLYDVAAVRADRPAMHWRRSLARELAERPLDDIWVLVGAGVAAAPRRLAARARRHARPAGRPADAARLTPTYGPVCTGSAAAHGAARPGHGGLRRAVGTGPGGAARRSTCGRRRTSANSTTYGPTWTPRSPTASGGSAWPGGPPCRCMSRAADENRKG